MTNSMCSEKEEKKILAILCFQIGRAEREHIARREVQYIVINILNTIIVFWQIIIYKST